MGSSDNDLAVPGDRQTAITADGFVYDVETGEVLSLVSGAGHALDERWQVDSVDSADWVLQLRSGIEAEIAGIDLQIAAVLEMLHARKRAALRRLSWWEWRFGPSLLAFARSCLQGRERTAQFSWGKVSFRRTGGTNEIIDMKAAVDWMRMVDPARIQVKESVRVRDVLQLRDLLAEESGEADAGSLPFLVSSEPSENVTISTGIAISREQEE